MQHLRIDRLAELADGEPEGVEREHLAACASCAAELKAYRHVVAMAGDERRRIAPPLTQWELLAPALHGEGLMGPNARRTRPGSAMWQRWAVRAAAAALMLGSGAVGGRVSAGLGMREAFLPRASAPRDASGTFASNAGEVFASTNDALAALRSAQDVYTRAASYLATHDTSSSEQAPELYRTRLAALDRGAETFRQALDQSPEDPIINQYYLATLGAREATLTRLGTVLPAGARLSRF